MQLITNIFSYSAAVLFGVAAWFTLITAVVFVLYWEGVIEFLLGA